MLKIIGLDANGDPITDEVWAKFAGRLGAHQTNDFDDALDVNGGPLSRGQHDVALAIVKAAKALGQIPDSIKYGDGPIGPGGRDFVTGLRRQGRRLWRFENTNTGHNTSDAPCVLTFKNRFHIFYRDSGRHNGVMHITHKDGGWHGGPHFHVDATTSAGPFAIEFQGRIHLFLRDGAGDALLHFISDENGEGFRGAQPFRVANLRTGDRPSAAILNGRLCVVCVDGGGNAIMWADYYPERPEAQRWETGNTGFNTSHSPSIVEYQNELHVFYKDSGGKTGLMHILRGSDGKWKPGNPAHPDYTTSKGPYAIAIENQLHVFFRDGQSGANGILHIASSDGHNFQTTAPSWYTGMRFDSMPSAAVLGDRLFLAGRNFEGSAVMCGIADLANK